VKDTEGEVLGYQGEIITAYFFSTSCGKTAGIEAWKMEHKEEFDYLQSISVSDSKDDDYEKHLPWYRWEVKVSKQQLRDILELHAKVELGELEKLEILRTGAGGIVLELKAVGSKGEFVVQTENKIRKALGDASYQIKRNDGSVVMGTDLLPSAFFTLENDGEDYVIRGGGYGHGIGMSQNGANEMAKAGLSYKEILASFYNGADILYGSNKK
jgi:stage II sporulation protein D